MCLQIATDITVNNFERLNNNEFYILSIQNKSYSEKLVYRDSTINQSHQLDKSQTTHFGSSSFWCVTSYVSVYFALFASLFVTGRKPYTHCCYIRDCAHFSTLVGYCFFLLVLNRFLFIYLFFCDGRLQEAMSQLVLGNDAKHTLNLRSVGVRSSKVSLLSGEQIQLHIKEEMNQFSFQGDG